MKTFIDIFKTIVLVSELCKLFLKNNKKLILMDLVLGFSRECKMIIEIILPTIIIKNVLLKQKIPIILIVILFLCILIAIGGILSEKIARDLSNYSLYATNSLYYVLNGKTAHLDMKDCEDEDVVNRYYKVFDSIYDLSDVPYEVFCTLISKIMSFIIMSLIIVSINIWLFLFVLIINLLIIIIRTKHNQIEHEYNLMCSEYSDKLKYLNEMSYNFEACREIRVFNASNLVSKKIFEQSGKVHKIDYKLQIINFVFNILYSLLNIAQLIFIYFLTINEYSLGKIALGNFAVYINATTLIFSSLSVITNSIGKLHKSTVSFKDFSEFLKMKETMRKPGGLTYVKQNSEVLFEFINVYFKYPGAKDYVLKNINFKIHDGEKISIVGDNGSGKSTLIKLILRLYDTTEGKILFRGVDIKEYDYDFYQSIIAPVFQDYVMHAYTLRENLIFDKNCSNVMVWDALAKTDMDKKVKKLGLDKNYTKRFYSDGIEFSGGEEQRFVIARALCKNTNIVILDEPTAAIDPIAERKLFSELLDAIDSKSVIFVSHRMSVTKYSDRIIVLKDSTIKESGTHDELLNLNGIYANMFRQQASYYN